jgi:hypothetical protein
MTAFGIAESPQAGQALIGFLTNPDAATIFRDQGFKPGDRAGRSRDERRAGPGEHPLACLGRPGIGLRWRAAARSLAARRLASRPPPGDEFGFRAAPKIFHVPITLYAGHHPEPAKTQNGHRSRHEAFADSRGSDDADPRRARVSELR